MPTRRQALVRAAPRGRWRPLLAACMSATALSVLVAGCGGGSASSTTKPRSAPASSATTASPPAAPSPSPQGGRSSVLTGPVHARLRAENHAPKANRLWSYSVRVSDDRGRPLSGRVAIEFLLGDTVVGRDTPPTHPITRGQWRDRVTFPNASVGHPLTFRAVVHVGSHVIRLDWPIMVRR